MITPFHDRIRWVVAVDEPDLPLDVVVAAAPPTASPAIVGASWRLAARPATTN